MIYNVKLFIDSIIFIIVIDFNFDLVICVLNGGEDYELLFIIVQFDYDKIKGNLNMMVIGFMIEVENGIYFVDFNELLVLFKVQGWNYFGE